MFGFGVDAYKRINEAVARKAAIWLRSKHASGILGLISFAESSFAPILIDPFLVALILASPKKWKRFVVVSILASVAGGIFAYVLGALFFETLGSRLVSLYHLDAAFASASESLNNNGFVFVLLGALTPIPYKIVALASGLLHLNFFTFVIASIIGRILRLGLVGVAAHAVGPQALPIIRKNLYTIASVVGILLILYIIVRLFF